jgi:LPS O-antigen subunit length determinant protein (WzzB/FepE family)
MFKVLRCSIFSAFLLPVFSIPVNAQYSPLTVPDYTSPAVWKSINDAQIRQWYPNNSNRSSPTPSSSSTVSPEFARNFAKSIQSLPEPLRQMSINGFCTGDALTKAKVDNRPMTNEEAAFVRKELGC